MQFKETGHGRKIGGRLEGNGRETGGRREGDVR